MKRAFVLLTIEEPNNSIESISNSFAEALANIANIAFNGKSGMIQMFDAKEIKGISFSLIGQVKLIHRSEESTDKSACFMLNTLFNKTLGDIPMIILKGFPTMFAMRLVKFVGRERSAKELLNNILTFQHDYPTIFKLAYQNSRFAVYGLTEQTFRTLIQNALCL